MGKFVFNNKEYEYYPNISERAVEIPIAMEYLQRYAEDDILEVGNVLFFWKSEYFIGKSKRHIVVDKNEVSGFPEVLNIDIMDYKPDRKFGLIICISTLEHIGWDCKIRNSPKCYSALLKMESLLDSGGILFLTFPVRYNNYLDKIYGDGLLPLTNSAIDSLLSI